MDSCWCHFRTANADRHSIIELPADHVCSPTLHDVAPLTMPRIAPSFLAAACYMTFGRIVYLVTPENRRGIGQTWVPIRHVTTIFVALDFFTFVIQCIGVIVMIAYISQIESAEARTPGAKQAVDFAERGLARAYRLLQAGFIMQIVFFVAFLVIAFRFMFVAKSWRYDWPEQGNGKWRKIAWAVIGASGLVTVSKYPSLRDDH